MAKKKSKTQKSKKNQKKKVQKLNKVSQSKKVVNNTPKKNTNTPKKNTTKVEEKKSTKPVIPKETPKKQVVDKDKVKYNVLLTNKTLKEEPPKKEIVKEQPKKNTQKVSSILLKKVKQKPNKKDKKIIEKPNNTFLRLLYNVYHNTHILFNSLLIVTYIILLVGFITTNAFTTGTIIYVSCIVIFLSIVAICYNKYLSGKIFSSLIIIGMALAIYNMQYTYDFIRNLNSNEFEYKEYYVVTFNNGQNKSIYNINNKKVGLLKDNSTNIERILNTKLDSVNYIEYEDPNLLYQDFYNHTYRAIIVNDNQYKYLTNNIEQSTKKVKILYKFKANGRK